MKIPYLHLNESTSLKEESSNFDDRKMHLYESTLGGAKLTMEQAIKNIESGNIKQAKQFLIVGIDLIEKSKKQMKSYK